MQQTENYKLNLIETSDPFSPVPLNENAQKTEAALTALTGTGAEFDQRIHALELKQLVFGSYTGTGKAEQFIDLGFTPIAVLIRLVSANTTPMTLALAGQSDTRYVAIVEGGFYAKNLSVYFNGADMDYNYIAFR